MSNPANTFLKFSSCLCDRVPTPCLGGMAARLFTPNFPPSLAPPSLLQLLSSVFIQGLC